MNCLAVDVGLRKMGMAVGSTVICEARPLPLVTVASRHVMEVLVQVKKWQVKKIIIGDPGQREENQPLLDYIILFKKELLKQLPTSCSILDWDEQGSSQEAKRLQKEQGLYEHATDSLAAMLILQSYFDFGLRS